MGILSQNQQYPLLEGTAVNGIYGPIFAADFKAIEVSIGHGTGADYDITMWGSNSNPAAPALPDPTTSPATDNLCFDVAFIDENLNQYNSTSPFNPTGLPAGAKRFHVQSEGLRWIFIQVSNAAGGDLEAVVDLFSNYS